MIFGSGTANRDYMAAYTCNFVMTIIAISGKMKEKISKTFLMFILITCIDETIETVIYRLEITLKDYKYIHYWMNLLSSLWGLFILSVIFIYICKNKKKHSILGKKFVYRIIVITGFALLMTVACLNFSKSIVKLTRFQYIADFVTSISYISLCLLCWMLIYFRRQDELKTQLLETEDELLIAQGNYYQLLLQKEEDTRKFRHDLTNHLLCLNYYIEKKDLSGAGNYLAEMSGKMEQINKRTYTTGNDLIDIIFNNKFSSIKENTDIQIHGKFFSELNISEMDLCTIFSNLFQNATEELAQQQAGWFRLQINQGKEFAEIIVKNSVSLKIVLQDDGFPKTKKTDSRNHGLGLRNVKVIVDKNDGNFLILSHENYFEVRIQLHNLPIRDLNNR
jgi:hypothetical protein